ncbi:MAG: thiolase family protein [Bacteriovoracaceae bacterium]
MAQWKGYASARNIYIVDGRRTPFGRFGGSLKSLSPVDLSEHSSRALIQSLNISPELIDHVVFASVIPTTTDTLYAGRHLALRLGCKLETPAYSVNRLCGSGFQAIIDAYNIILRDEAKCVLAAGAEAMSGAPHLTYGGRFGTKYGALKSEDILLDSLTDKHCGTPMGITAENLAKKFQISREACEEFSLNSHKLACSAYEQGHFSDEVCTVALKRGELSQDEHVRGDGSLEEMAKLRASFEKGGTVTPATASGIVDGAASVLVADEEFVKEHNLKPLARIVDHHVVGVEPKIMGIGPAPAIRGVLKKVDKTLDDMNIVEINEAFAAQAIACAQELELAQERLNLWGGSIAIGHPLAATGARITLTAARQMQKLDKENAMVSACIGGGQGIAIYLERAS